MSGLNPGRRAAAAALLAAERGRHLEEELERPDSASPADLALARHLAAGVMRRRGELDLALGPHCRRPLAKLDGPVRVALRIGAFELLFSRTPAHAAVDQAVRLVRGLGAAHSAGLVNAVLRRVREVPEHELTCNHPEWLVNRWVDRYGAEATRALCARDDSLPGLGILALGDPERALRALTGAAGSLRPALIGDRPVEGAFILEDPRGPVAELPGFREGWWSVMDPAAVAVAGLVRARPGLRVLDACAAPGGKTLRLADLGARVHATDRAERRLERVAENLRRTGLSAEVSLADWLSAEPPAAAYDAVLLDAPCTGLGTLRRHPEIRWSRLPSDPMAMAITQLTLLRRLSAAVRPGGALVYAVCSPEPEEGAEVVAAFLRENPAFRMEEELVIDPARDAVDLHYAARLIAGGPP